MFSSKQGEPVANLHTKRLGAMPTACGTFTRLACERVEAAGIKSGPLLKKVGLTKQQVENRQARFGVDRQIRLLELAAEALQDKCLGFHLGQMVELRELGLLFYVAASSETLGEALRQLARYSLVADESLTLKYSDGEDIRISFNFVGLSRNLDQHQIDIWLTSLIRLCRELTSYHVDPIRVRLAHRGSCSPEEVARFVRGNVEFGAPVDEIVLPSSLAGMPMVGADPYLNRLLIAHSDGALSRLPTKRGAFRSVVEHAIARLLPHGNIRASKVARCCGLSDRTLVRRLASERLTFLEVLNDLRHEVAMQYLDDDGLSISQIAWLLGYHEVGAFTNAFKRWTGKTPRQARLQLRQSDSSPDFAPGASE